MVSDFLTPEVRAKLNLPLPDSDALRASTLAATQREQLLEGAESLSRLSGAPQRHAHTQDIHRGAGVARRLTTARGTVLIN